MNTLNPKVWADLARHRTRTLLAAGTLAVAIASLGFLAVPGLLNATLGGSSLRVTVNVSLPSYACPRLLLQRAVPRASPLRGTG